MYGYSKRRTSTIPFATKKPRRPDLRLNIDQLTVTARREVPPIIADRQLQVPLLFLTD